MSEAFNSAVLTDPLVFVLCRAAVKLAYDPLNSTELALKPGQAVLVTEKDIVAKFSKGMIEGTGVLGLFPNACVEFAKSATF